MTATQPPATDAQIVDGWRDEDNLVLRDLSNPAILKCDALTQRDALDICREFSRTGIPADAMHWDGSFVRVVALPPPTHDMCMLDCDSPSYPPEVCEYQQCGCNSCRRWLYEHGHPFGTPTERT